MGKKGLQLIFLNFKLNILEKVCRINLKDKNVISKATSYFSECCHRLSIWHASPLKLSRNCGFRIRFAALTVYDSGQLGAPGGRGAQHALSPAAAAAAAASPVAACCVVSCACSATGPGSGCRVTVIDIQLGLRLRTKGTARGGGVEAAGRGAFAEGGGTTCHWATWRRDGQRGARQVAKHNLGKGVDAGGTLKSTAVLAPERGQEVTNKTQKPKSWNTMRKSMDYAEDSGQGGWYYVGNSANL